MNASGSRIAFTLGGGDLRFSGAMVGDRTIRGTVDGDEGQGAFVLHRTAVPALPYRVEDVVFANNGVTLDGTLCVPRSQGRHPAVVLLQGSGPQSRWGTNRFIADRLARSGIAALAFDKRGSGASTGDWRTVGYDALADDAIAGTVFIAKRSGRIAFIVAADSNASTNQQQDLLRIKNEIRDNGWTGRNGADALAVYRQFCESQVPVAAAMTISSAFCNAKGPTHGYAGSASRREARGCTHGTRSSRTTIRACIGKRFAYRSCSYTGNTTS